MLQRCVGCRTEPQPQAGDGRHRRKRGRVAALERGHYALALANQYGVCRHTVRRRAPARSAVIAAEAEGVAGRVDEYPDIVLRLVSSDRGSEGDRLGYRGVEVSDLEVEVNHRALLPVDGRPHRGLVTGRLLEHDIDGSLGSGED